MNRMMAPGVLWNENMSRICVMCATLAFVAADPGQARASVIVSWTGSNSFNDDTISFAGFQASELTDITGPGHYHAHGGSTTVFLDILLDGVWTNLYSDSIGGDNVPHYLDSIPTSFSFAQGTVSGLRLASHDINNTYHNLSSLTKFEFNNVAAPVPEPGSLAIFSLGTLGLAVGGVRRRRRSQSA